MSNPSGSGPRAFNAIGLLTEVAERQLYVIAGIADGIMLTQSKRGWVGPDFSRDQSRARWVANSKAWEAILFGSVDGITVGPPDVRHPLLTGFKGWFRDHGLVIAASGQTDKEDLFWATLGAASNRFSYDLHHVGFGHPTLDAMLKAVASDEERTHRVATWPQSPTHFRAYIWQADNTLIHGGYWVEHFYLPSLDSVGSDQPMETHVDLYCPDAALGLLSYVASAQREEPTMFVPSANGPLGSFYVGARDNHMVGMMVRPYWWDIPIVLKPSGLEEEMDRILQNLRMRAQAA